MYAYPIAPATESVVGLPEQEAIPPLDLLMLLKHLQSNIALVAEEHGLTLMQLYTMHAIGEEHKTMGKMAQAMRCDASNVTGIIDKLLAMGMVTRQEDPNDRRIKTVELTAAGGALLKKIVNVMPSRLGYSSLSQREILEFRRIFQKLTTSVHGCDQE
ncbi:MAG TPA: MarR family transcriptional regulator [Pyrinomonadaceae bacterium]|nr:MarR family transcriptional regulator [Pyrinomonadaceae bacterium]